MSRNIASLLVALGLVFGGYKAIAWTNEHTMLNDAKVRCVEFAKERNVFPGDQTVEAMEAWTKHDGRYAVVALSNGNSTPFKSSICVRSSYMIKIPSLLEEHVWY